MPLSNATPAKHSTETDEIQNRDLPVMKLPKTTGRNALSALTANDKPDSVRTSSGDTFDFNESTSNAELESPKQSPIVGDLNFVKMAYGGLSPKKMREAAMSTVSALSDEIVSRAPDIPSLVLEPNNKTRSDSTTDGNAPSKSPSWVNSIEPSTVLTTTPSFELVDEMHFVKLATGGLVPETLSPQFSHSYIPVVSRGPMLQPMQIATVSSDSDEIDSSDSSEESLCVAHLGIPIELVDNNTLEPSSTSTYENSVKTKVSQESRGFGSPSSDELLKLKLNNEAVDSTANFSSISGGANMPKMIRGNSLISSSQHLTLDELFKANIKEESSMQRVDVKNNTIISARMPERKGLREYIDGNHFHMNHMSRSSQRDFTQGSVQSSLNDHNDVQVDNESMFSRADSLLLNDSGVHDELLRIKRQQDGSVPRGLVQVNVQSSLDENDVVNNESVSREFIQDNNQSFALDEHNFLNNGLISREPVQVNNQSFLFHASESSFAWDALSRPALSENEPLPVPLIFASRQISCGNSSGKNNSFSESTTSLKRNDSAGIRPGAYRRHISGAQPQPMNDMSDDEGIVDKEEKSLYTRKEAEKVIQELQAAEEGLAVAVPVDADDDIDGMVSAVEVDPDAKPTLTPKFRRRRRVVVLVIIILVIIVFGIISLTLLVKRDRTMDVIPSIPLSARESLGIQDVLEQIVGSEAITTDTYSRALQWIIHDDPLQLTLQNATIVQRFFAAYLYFSVTVNGPMLTCNPPQDPWVDSSSCSFKRMYDYFRDQVQYLPETSSAWLSNAPECSWSGIQCDKHDQIHSITLAGASLSGTFPTGIVNFPFLTTINLGWNSLTGTLPENLFENSFLSYLEISSNQFTETIPTNWWSATSLQYLNVGTNNLVGSIPLIAGNVIDLKYLGLNNNSITGVIPTEIGKLDSLNSFIVHMNALQGTLPSTISNLKLLENFLIHINSFSGTVPSFLGQLNDTLIDLTMKSNLFIGTIPDDIYACTQLTLLDLSFNSLTGTLSSIVGDLGTEIHQLILSYNKFTGTIPSTITKLQKISTISLEGNDFTGTIPEEFCAYKADAYKVDGILDTVQADCSLNASGVAELGCPIGCCSLCCNADGHDCVPQS